VLVTSLNPSHQPAGWGAYAIRALPDLCLEIVCQRLENYWNSVRPGHSLSLCIGGYEPAAGLL